jgi:hypothetical protein
MYGVSSQNNRLNILELHRKMNQRNEKKSVCYEKVLEICNKRILNQTERDKTHCLFEFPEYVAGYPLFDLNACIKYCEKQLVANGFLVKYYFPNKFYISWDFEEIKKHKEEQRKTTPLVAILPNGNNNTTNTTSYNNGNGNVNGPKLLTMAPNQLPPPLTPSPQVPQTSPHVSQTSPQHVSLPMQHLQQQMHSAQTLPQTSHQTSPSSFVQQQQTTVPSALHAKMTAPLPTALPKYDPFDLYSSSIHAPSTNSKGTEQSEGKKASAIDNSFFANSFKQTLTSGIGSSKMFDYKPSGKLTLNI